MGISSAMNAGVMGLQVQSSKLSTISDNIANSETKGYKRANMEFASLVLSERPTTYDAGGVRAATVRYIEDQGAVLGTRNVLDLALSGKGFLPVTPINQVENPDRAFRMVRTGAFQPDAEGYVRTTNGFALMGWKPDIDGSFSSVARESTNSLVPVKLDNVGLAADPTSRLNLSLNLDERQTGLAVAPTVPYMLPVEFFNELGGSGQFQFEFLGTTTANQWRMGMYEVTDGTTDPVTREMVAEATLNFDASGANAGGLSDPGGFTITATGTGFPTYAGTSYDPLTGDISLQTSTGQAININIGRLGTRDKFTQYESNFEPYITKNGSPASPMRGLEVDEKGNLNAIFESGFRRTLYKIPVGMVVNPNGLTSLDGPAYSISSKSGGVYFYDSGTGPAGRLISSALEESTTDVAEELTQLIKTQRAYSSNAKIIQTADEMLQETTNLKR